MVLREIGAYRPDLDARLKLKGSASDLATKLDAITAGAAFVLGHNVVAFDQPALAALHPGLALHRLPLIDTLELSPVAFPQNLYHRLVKDYKLCTTMRNDPVRDAELAYALFLDQSEALRLRGTDAEERGLGDAGEEAIIAAMVENPAYVNRPFVETEKGVRFCRPQDLVREIL